MSYSALRVNYGWNVRPALPNQLWAPKHNHYKDFGYPEQLSFNDFFSMYERNGLGAAAVDKTVNKTWQDFPFLQEKQRDAGEEAKETLKERRIRQRFDDLRFWQHLAEADRRGLVGAYAGVILRFADGEDWDKPVGQGAIRSGLAGLVEVIPAWEGQLQPAEWQNDVKAADYGQPTMYQFNEAAVAGAKTQNPRALRIHPDRVVVWSRDGTVNGRSAMQAGYNDLITLEKIIGAGGEGFWKNAKSAPVLEIDKEAKLDQMAKAMGIKPEDLLEAMNEQMEAVNRGFDNLLMVQGMKANPLQVNLPSPEHFFDAALQSYCASWQMPSKILVGNQTGERASTEDSAEWAQTCMGRRANVVRPNIMAVVNRLEYVGVLPKRDWHLDWADLTEASMGEKVERVVKMADANSKNPGEIVFTSDDMRSAVGMEPLSPAVKAKEPAVDPNASNPGEKPDEGEPKDPPEPKANIVLPIRA